MLLQSQLEDAERTGAKETALLIDTLASSTPEVQEAARHLIEQHPLAPGGSR